MKCTIISLKDYKGPFKDMTKNDIFDKYFRAQNELEEKYGSRSVVLMMVGSFYEIYGVDLPHSNPPIKLGQAEEAKNALGMNMTKKSKLRPHDMNNPHMVGFPDYAIDEHIGKLLRANFTVGVYDQYDLEYKDARGQSKTKKDRKLTHVYTPSTYVDDTQVETNSLIAVELSEYRSLTSKKMLKKCHVAVLSLNTGKAFLLEAYDTKDDTGKAESELYRIIHAYSPREIIYCGPENNKFAKLFDLQQQKIHFREIPKAFYRESYQNEFLLKIYPNTGIITPIEFLDLEKHSSVVPHFIQALQFAYEQDKLIVSRMQTPQFVETQTNLILNNDSIYQLNLVDSPNETTHTLLDVICKTKTAMGRRYLKSQLLSPLIDPVVIEKRYSQIDKMTSQVDKYTDLLRGIVDIEKKYRKMVVNKLHPYELADMLGSFTNICSLLNVARKMFHIPMDLIQDYECFYNEYSGTFDFSILKKSKLYDIKSNFFNVGVRTDLDALDKQVYNSKIVLHDIAKQLSRSLDKDSDTLVQVKSTTADGYYLFMTKRRFNNVPKTFCCKYRYNGLDQCIEWKDFEVTNLTNDVKVQSTGIRKISTDIVKHRERANAKITAAYNETIQHYVEEYGECLVKIADTIAKIDFVYSAATVATAYGYTRPQIVDAQEGNSYLQVSDIRHPIIERINDTEEYVTNDVSIGTHGHLGSVIYGLNMAGKSSVLKSIGDNLVLAQAGMYVSASQFTYYPFKYLLSKMTIRDNISKGQSTFMIEILEIRDMIMRSGPNTLILSDELCSSTESSSGHAIVAQTLQTLTEKKAKFIFSTHLHELQKIKQVCDNEAIKVFHFKVRVENDELIFDRKIVPGGMTDLYGLEVARALGLPNNFIRGAFGIRDSLTGKSSELLSMKQSRYNKDVYVDKCSKCGSTANLDTHHLRHQQEADERGLIDKKFHKNSKFNLQVLCHKCHVEEHSTYHTP